MSKNIKCQIKDFECINNNQICQKCQNICKHCSKKFCQNCIQNYIIECHPRLGYGKICLDCDDLYRGF